MPTNQTSLRRLITSLQHAAENHQSDQVESLKQEAVRIIKRKRERFARRYGINLTAWDRVLDTAPDQVADFLDSDDFQLLLGRDVDISYAQLPKSPAVYCPKAGREVAVANSLGRLIFENPLTGSPSRGHSIQSWARASSKSREYKKHLCNSKHPKASKFLRAIDIEVLEYGLFDRPLGLLKSASQLFFYATYDKNIGKLSDGSLTNHIAMQCDRTRRKIGTGYFSEIHAYPVSEAEIRNDFQGAPSHLLGKILNDVLSVDR